ncbi:MAG: hypothetical protein ABIZ81_01045 [Opitutaceae bacterium]
MPSPFSSPELPAATTDGPLRALLYGGLACGILDLAAAMISSRMVGGASPQRLLQTIAGGLLGSSSYQGGGATAALGLVLHFAISFGAAGVYLALSRKFPALNRHAILSGLGYGFLCYWFMSGVVLPLSALHAPIPTAIGSARVIRPLVIHLLFVGLPIALAVRHWTAPERSHGSR